MKSIIIAIIFSLTTCQSSSDKSLEWPWNALLIENHKSINIFDSVSQENVKYTIKNDTLTEDYVLMEVLSKRDNFFYVKTASALDDKIVSEGWIESKHVGIYLRAKNVTGDVPIYSSPNDKSEFKFINANGKGLVEILDINPKGWFKIICKDKKGIIVGWLSKENQCPNPYSTCN